LFVDGSDEGIDSDGERAQTDYALLAGHTSPAGVVSNPEYFDDDAFDLVSPVTTGSGRTGNGGLPANHRLGSDRLGSGGSKDYYNSLDEDSAVGGMTMPHSSTGRERLSSRV
jgi:hypothetical protein